MQQIRVTRLCSGYFLVRGIGPCNWAQPPTWPCTEETLRASAFPEASEELILAAIAKSQESVK